MPAHKRTAQDEARQNLAFEQERALLGAALSSREAYDLLTSSGDDLLFEHIAHQDLWATLRFHAEKDARFEPPAILESLLQIRLDQTNPPGTLISDCIREAVGLDSAIYYANRMRERANQSRLRTAATAALHQIATGDLDEAQFTALIETLRTAIDAATPVGDPSDTGGWGDHNLVAAALDGTELEVNPSMLVNDDGIAAIYPGRLHTISGEPESGKTWIALAAVAQVLNIGGQAMLLDFEDNAQTAVSRLITLGVDREAIRERFHYRRPHEPISSAARAALRPNLANIDIVILDGVTGALTLHGYDVNSNEDVENFYRHMRWIAAQRPAVVMIDHVTKSLEGRGRHAIGAQHKLAGIEGAAYTVTRGQPFRPGGIGTAKIMIAKDRVGSVRAGVGGNTFAHFNLDSTTEQATWGFTSAVATVQLDSPRTTVTNRACAEAIAVFLATNPDVSKNAVETAVPFGRTTVRQTVTEMIADGVLNSRIGDRRTVHLSLA